MLISEINIKDCLIQSNFGSSPLLGTLLKSHRNEKWVWYVVVRECGCLKSSIFGRIILLWNFPIFLQFACPKWFWRNEWTKQWSNWTLHTQYIHNANVKIEGTIIIQFALLNRNMSIFFFTFFSLAFVVMKISFHNTHQTIITLLYR